MVSVYLKRASTAAVIGMLTLAVSAWAAEIHCDICGMTIPERARNHVVLKSAEPNAKVMHLCSLSCVRKARKHDPKLSKAEIADFNRPEAMLPGDKAFFLIQSQKIKADMGEMAMAPYVVGFRTKQEAEAAKAKYGDGIVVEGAENAFK